MPDENDSTPKKGSGAFARILRSEVLLHTRRADLPDSVESQLLGWGFDVRVQRSLASLSVAIVSGALSNSPRRLVLLDQPAVTTIEDLSVAIAEAQVEVPVTWILVDPNLEILPLLDRFGSAVRVVEGLESDLFDAMVWASAMAEGEGSGNAHLPEPTPSVERQLTRGPDGTPARVLLVEDNEINRMVVEEILGDSEIDLHVAENGLEAVEKVADQSFDVVLMDCQMPVVDGFEATRRIRELEANGVRCHPSGHLPIIALTANAIRGDQARCLAAGMDDYLTKPFDDALLFEVIGRYLHPEETPSTEPVADCGSDASRREPSPFRPKECLGRCAGNLDLAKRLVGMLIEQGERETTQLTDQVAAEDWSAVRQTAHGLRGAAGNLGATSLHESLTKLEALVAQSPDREEADRMLREIRSELDRFKDSDPLFTLDQFATTEGPSGSRSHA